MPSAHVDEVLDHANDLGGGGLGDVVGRPQPQGVQDLAPRGPARFQGGDERVGPARHELVRGPATATVDVAERAVRTGRRIRPEPMGDVHRQDQAPVGGMGNPASTCRSRGTSTFPLFNASYIAPCPRRCSATNVRSTGAVTGSSAHSSASDSSNSSSPRVVRQSKKSSRRDASANASPGTSRCGRLILTAFVLVRCIPWSEHRIGRRPPTRLVNFRVREPVRRTIRHNGAREPRQPA